MRHASRRTSLEPARVMPLMRARVVGVDGAARTCRTPTPCRKQGRLTREFGVTYRDTLQSNERLVAGTFWDGPRGRRGAGRRDAEVSISEEVRDDAGVGVGDIVRSTSPARWSARASPVSATWPGTRRRTAASSSCCGRPGDRARCRTRSWASSRTGEDPTRRATPPARAGATGSPTSRSIDVRAVVASIRDVLDNITLGITVVGAMTLVSGILILIGAVAMTKFQRAVRRGDLPDAGRQHPAVATMVAVEYGLLGALAGLVGAAGRLRRCRGRLRGICSRSPGGRRRGCWPAERY